MAQQELKFTCPKCGQQYTCGYSLGPRSTCPGCGYEPMPLELMHNRQHATPYVIGLLILAAILGAVFALTM